MKVTFKDKDSRPLRSKFPCVFNNLSFIPRVNDYVNIGNKQYKVTGVIHTVPYINDHLETIEESIVIMTTPCS